jgi:hypothetical protein
MQKIGTTRQIGTRPDETGMKRKIGAQIQTLHHGTLETPRRYYHISLGPTYPTKTIYCACIFNTSYNSMVTYKMMTLVERANRKEFLHDVPARTTQQMRNVR